MIITNGRESWCLRSGNSFSVLLKQIDGDLLRLVDPKEYRDWWEVVGEPYMNNVMIDDKRFVIEETGLDGVSFLHTPSLSDFYIKRLLVPPDAKSWRSLADIFPPKEKIVILDADIDDVWWNRENCE